MYVNTDQEPAKFSKESFERRSSARKGIPLKNPI